MASFPFQIALISQLFSTSIDILATCSSPFNSFPLLKPIQSRLPSMPPAASVKVASWPSLLLNFKQDLTKIINSFSLKCLHHVAASTHTMSRLPLYLTLHLPSLVIHLPDFQPSEFSSISLNFWISINTHSLNSLIQSSGFRQNLRANETQICIFSHTPTWTPVSHTHFNWHLNMPQNELLI